MNIKRETEKPLSLVFFEENLNLTRAPRYILDVCAFSARQYRPMGGRGFDSWGIRNKIRDRRCLSLILLVEVRGI